MTAFTFTSRETYLQYRKQWFLKYQELINNVRSAKIEIKEAMRSSNLGRIWGSYSAKRQASIDVDTHLLELCNARIEASRQYFENREKIANLKA